MSEFHDKAQRVCAVLAILTRKITNFHRCLMDSAYFDHLAARLDRPTLSIVLQALTGHKYLNYHHYIVGTVC